MVWVLSGLSWFAASTLVAQTADPPLVVTGTLIDERGTPLGGVEVALRPYPSDYEVSLNLLGEADTLPEPAGRTVSGPDGAFVVSASRVGAYRLGIRSTPRMTQSAVTYPLVHYDLAPLKLPLHLEPLELPHDYPLAVRVLDFDGLPIGGAFVLVDFGASQDEGNAVSQPSVQPQRLYPRFGRASARTDAEGVARFIGPAREADVVVSAPGHGARSARVNSGRTTVQFDAEAMVTLRVLRVDGRPAHRAVVRSGTGRRLPLALTDERGEATIHLPLQGREVVECETVDGEFARGVVRTPQGGTAMPPIVEMRLSEPVHIRGRVVDTTTTLEIPGTAVWVHSDPGRATLTDQLGGFDLTVPFRGDQLSLGVAASGYVSATVSAWPEPAPEQLIGLTAAVPFAGWIVDGFDRPVSGASVWAEPSGQGLSPFGKSGAGRAISGPDGSFWIDNVVYSRPYRLTVDAEGFASSVLELPPFEQAVATEPARIVLTNGRQPWGTVVSLEGAPVAGAQVALLWPQADMELGAGIISRDAIGPVTSNARGEFEFSSVAPGRYGIEISHPEYVDAQGQMVNVSHGDGYADLGTFIITPGAEIHGVVTDLNGRRLEGAQVRSTQDSRGMSLHVRTGITDGEGLFRLSGHLPVLADLTATADGYAPGGVQSVRPATGEPVVIELADGASVAGRVLARDGSPAAAVDVQMLLPPKELFLYVDGLEAEHLFHQARTDGDGHFRFDSLVPAAWSVVASDKMGGTARARVEVTQGELREVVLELGTPDRLMLYVKNRFGDPVASADVEVRPAAPTETGIRGRTDASGQAVLPITAGRAAVKVEHPDLLAQSRNIVLHPGDNELQVQLDHGWEISGTVRSAGGALVPGTLVEAEEAAGAAGGTNELALELRRLRRLLDPPQQAISAGDGSFRLTGLDRGRYRLVAKLPGYTEGQSAHTVEVDGQSVTGVEIVLEPGASIQGAVTGLRPSEMASAEVLAWGGALLRSATPDSEGRFKLEALAPGTWRLVASAGERRSSEQSVTLEPGSVDASAELRFEPGFRLTGQLLVAGEPASGGVVGAALPGQNPRRTRTDHQGRFDIQGLPGGSYKLTFWHGRGIAAEQPLDLQSDFYNLFIDLQPGPVRPN